MVPSPVGLELQDANIGHPQPARLPPGRFGRLPALHHPPAPRRPQQNALLPRRKPLRPETPKLPALVQNCQRLGRPMDKVTLLTITAHWRIMDTSAPNWKATSENNSKPAFN